MSTKDIFSSLKYIARYIFMAMLFFITMAMWLHEEDHEKLRPPITVASLPLRCIELKPATPTHQDTVVAQPGHYCVIADFWQRRLHGAGHSWPGIFHQLIAVGASDTVIDINNHTLHSDGHSAGIGVSLDERNWGKTKTITIKNGVIDLRGVGTGVESHHKWNMFPIDEQPPSGIMNYDEPHLILENLLIKTDNIGIVLTGDGNIIRNCIIESGGNGAIMIAGPNNQILNNSIILADPFIPGREQGQNYFSQPGSLIDLLEARREPKAAIALHHSTGTIIRGNRIEVKGKSPTRHNIYLTDESKQVQIEENTFIGTEDPVTLAKGSAATMKKNVFESRRRWWQF